MAKKQENHPNKSRRFSCYCLTVRCWTQYFTAIQSVLHAMRALCCRFRKTSPWCFYSAPRLKVATSLSHSPYVTNLSSPTKKRKYPVFDLRFNDLSLHRHAVRATGVHCELL